MDMYAMPCPFCPIMLRSRSIKLGGKNSQLHQISQSWTTHIAGSYMMLNHACMLHSGSFFRRHAAFSCEGSSGMETKLWPGRFEFHENTTQWDHYRNVVNLQVFDLLVRLTLHRTAGCNGPLQCEGPGKVESNSQTSYQPNSTTATPKQKHQPQEHHWRRRWQRQMPTL